MRKSAPLYTAVAALAFAGILAVSPLPAQASLLDGSAGGAVTTGAGTSRIADSGSAGGDVLSATRNSGIQAGGSIDGDSLIGQSDRSGADGSNNLDRAGVGIDDDN